MLERIFPEKSRIAARRALASIVLVTNAFVWYFFAITILINIVGTTQLDYFTTLLIWSVHFAGIAFSAIIGATLVRRMGGQTRFFILWMILGIVSSVTSIAVDKTSAPEIIILSLFLGVSLGIGMPSCMGYFTESVEIGHRGRAGGIILLLSGLLMAVLGMISSGDLGLQTIILSAWRLIGLVFFLLFRRMGESVKQSVTPFYKSILSQRPFILYLVPWIMFSLITYLTYPIQSELVEKSTLESLQIIENVLYGVFAVVGGFLADIMGRKRMSIAGFAMLGLGYSVLGIFPEQLYSWYFYTVVDGVAWGILFVIFVVTIWGDLSHSAASDKYYAIGVLPFFISKFLQLTIGNDIVAAIPSPSSIFSFTAFFLFLAVLPLFYAPETLPEKMMKDRDLKSYAQKALEKAEKEEKKKTKKTVEEPKEKADS